MKKLENSRNFEKKNKVKEFEGGSLKKIETQEHYVFKFHFSNPPSPS